VRRCSAGIACSKLLSKLISGLHKPDDQSVMLPAEAEVRRCMGSVSAAGSCCIRRRGVAHSVCGACAPPPGACWHAQAFVAPLPVRALPGVGYKSGALLSSWGVVTAADARRLSRQQLVAALGDKAGAWLGCVWSLQLQLRLCRVPALLWCAAALTPHPLYPLPLCRTALCRQQLVPRVLGHRCQPGGCIRPAQEHHC
jgi:hypothetical protein